MNLVVFGEFDGSCPELCSITAPRGRIELEAAGTRLCVGFARTRFVLPFLKIWRKARDFFWVLLESFNSKVGDFW